jgi:hypothetical protein
MQYLAYFAIEKSCRIGLNTRRSAAEWAVISSMKKAGDITRFYLICKELSL